MNIKFNKHLNHQATQNNLLKKNVMFFLNELVVRLVPCAGAATRRCAANIDSCQSDSIWLPIRFVQAYLRQILMQKGPVGKDGSTYFEEVVLASKCFQGIARDKRNRIIISIYAFIALHKFLYFYKLCYVNKTWYYTYLK